MIFLLVATLLGGCGLALYRHAEGDKILSVQTGSMVPYFNPGDALLTRWILLPDLHVGDVVSYRSPADQRVVVSHRLVSINYQTGKLITKGDALDMHDLPFPSGQVIGKVYKVLPHVGRGLDWLHEPTGLIIAVYTPAACALIYEAKRLSRQYTKPAYRCYGYR